MVHIGDVVGLLSEYDLRHFPPALVKPASAASSFGVLSDFIKSNAGPGRGPCPPALNGTCAGLRAPSLLAVRTADATGRASTTLFAPNPYSNAWNLWFQAFIEGAPAVATNVFEEL
jgi:hypothetical protein